MRMFSVAKDYDGQLHMIGYGDIVEQEKTYLKLPDKLIEYFKEHDLLNDGKLTVAPYTNGCVIFPYEEDRPEDFKTEAQTNVELHSVDDGHLITEGPHFENVPLDGKGPSHPLMMLGCGEIWIVDSEIAVKHISDALGREIEEHAEGVSR